MDDYNSPTLEMALHMNIIENNDHSKRVYENVSRWGCSSSIALFDPACKIFSTPGIEGMIGYHTAWGCSVVYGDPVCAPENALALAGAFHNYSQEQKNKVIYITASEAFARKAIQGLCGALMETNEELTLDPNSYPKQGSNGRLLRKKINHADRDGVSVHEYLMKDDILEQGMDEVGDVWLNKRTGPQIFLSHVHLFEERYGKRWFYALQDGKVVGVLLLNRLEAYGGWVLNLLMVTPDAPIGTSEYLVVSMLEALSKEDCHYLSFGAATSAQLGEMMGVGKLTQWVSKNLFNFTKKMFNLDGRRSFWEKFEPKKERSFVLFNRSGISFRDLLALSNAMNVSL